MSIQDKRVMPWFELNGDETLRLDYNLNNNSIVFDVGGYKGEWAEKIYEKYGCNIFIFEPIKEFYIKINERFKNNQKIKVYNFGLGTTDQNITISKSNDCSTAFSTNTEDTENCQVKSISNFIETNEIKFINLMKINIEGGEYDLLNSLVINNKLAMVENLQIQFHDFVADHQNLKKYLVEHLCLSHVCTYAFDYVWENWVLSDSEINKKTKYIYEQNLSFQNKYFCSLLEIDKFKNEIPELRNEISKLQLRINTLLNLKVVKIYFFIKKFFEIN